MSDVVERLIDTRNTLVDLFVQREHEITAVLAGLVSGEPVILVGPPGTAKTKLIDTLAKMINARYFYYLLTRFTEPDELLGPLDIQALREGVYRRITANRLPEAEIVFLDEIFKASSAVRNLLLDIILNKRYLNGTEYKKLPMLTLYTASNEISTDAEDMAFYDRLTIRVFVKNVGSDKWKELIIKGAKITFGFDGSTQPLMTVEDVRKLQDMARKRAWDATADRVIVDKYLEALGELKNRGIELSDRRKIKVLLVAGALSLLYGEARVRLEDIADALKYTAIHDEDDLKKVEETIIKTRLTSLYEQIQKLQAMEMELRNLYEQIKNKTERTETDFKVLRKTMVKVYTEVKKMDRKDPRLKEYVDRVLALLEEVKMFLRKLIIEMGGEDIM